MKRLQPQEGQSLVGVLVLLALLFFVGTAMSLSVSTSLQAITQSATALKAGYAAESAATHGASLFVQAQPAALSAGCAGPNSFDAKMGPLEPVVWTDCALVGVDTSSAAAAIAAPPALVRGGGCASSPVAVSNASGLVVWTAIAWHTVSGAPTLLAYMDDEAGCPSGSPSGTKCSSQQSVTLLYLSCPTTTTGAQYLRVYSTGGAAHVSGFLVRSAPQGIDCVVTVVGEQNSRAAVEVDVLLRGSASAKDGQCHSQDNTGVTVAALHRILP